jgi:hypothetical protein
MAEATVHVGNWWLEDNPNIKYPGSATYDVTNGWSLELIGGLHTEDVPLGSPLLASVIHGRTSDFHSITFPRAFVQGSPWPLPESAEATFSASAPGALVGRRAPERLEFEAVTISSPAITSWARRSGAIEMAEAGDGQRGFTIRVPEDVEIPLDNGRLVLRYSARGNISLSAVSQQIVTEWHYEPERPADIYSLLESVYRPLDYLHVVATGSHLGPPGINVWQGRDSWSWKSDRLRDDRPHIDRHWQWPLPIGLIEDLPRTVSTWFQLFTELGTALHPLMSVLTDDTPHKLETEILLLCHAVEGYHRRRGIFGQTQVPPEEHERRLEALLEGQPKAIRQWARPLLRHNQPSFRSRLEDLVNYVGPIGEEITGSEQFLSTTRRYRDTLAHGLLDGEAESSREWFDGMHGVSIKLQELMRVALLRDLGLSGVEAAEAARRLPSVELAIAYTPAQWLS